MSKRSLMLDDEQLNEKFASKAQQRYFYAKCDDGSNKEERKWCGMADEFSDDMTKSDWEDLPEKEEIEFVTELSNKFEKTIRRLYNIYENK